MNGQRDLDLLAQLESERSTLTAHYSELARFIWPDHDVFNRPAASGQQEGEKRALSVLDTTAAIAADRCASALMSMTAPTHKKYQSLTVDDDELADNPQVKRWLEIATDTLFRHRYAPRSGFAAQYHECCKSAVAFGPMATFVEDYWEGTRYHALSMSNTFFLTDSQGRVNGAVRPLEYTAAQLAQKFGAAVLPDKILQAMNSNTQADRLKKWKIVHVIEQMDNSQRVTGFRFAGRYTCEEGKAVLESRGFRTLPIAASRYSTMPGEKYGRSIAMTILPTIKGLQVMIGDYFKGLHKQVDPALLAADDDGVMTVIKAQPGKVTTGGVSSDGKPLVMPLSQPGRLDWVQAEFGEQRKQINDAFLTSLFQILSADPSAREQTAYEVSVREVEKAALLSPATDRIMDEYFGTLVPREIDILTQAGYLPPMPPELADRHEEIKVTHTGELARAQSADEILGIQRTLEVLELFSAYDSTAPKRIKLDEALARFAEGAGMPSKFIRTDDEMVEIREKDEQQQAAAAAAQLAAPAGVAAKNFAQAEQLRAGAPSQLGGYPA